MPGYGDFASGSCPGENIEAKRSPPVPPNRMRKPATKKQQHWGAAPPTATWNSKMKPETKDVPFKKYICFHERTKSCLSNNGREFRGGFPKRKVVVQHPLVSFHVCSPLQEETDLLSPTLQVPSWREGTPRTNFEKIRPDHRGRNSPNEIDKTQPKLCPGVGIFGLELAQAWGLLNLPMHIGEQLKGQIERRAFANAPVFHIL